MARRKPKAASMVKPRDVAFLESLPKMSETMLAFGAPLLDQFRPAPTLQQLQEALVLVTVAWNLPIYEQRKKPGAVEWRATFDKMAAAMPHQIREILTAMLRSRLTTYANDPRTAVARAEQGIHGEARVVATAFAGNAWVG